MHIEYSCIKCKSKNVSKQNLQEGAVRVECKDCGDRTVRVLLQE